MIISVFFFLFITIYCTSLNCIGQKRHKKSLNNKPIKMITEHLIEITNHKIQCSKYTLWNLTRRQTLVASQFCYCFSLMLTFVFFIPCWTLTSTLPPPLMLSSVGRFEICCAWLHTDLWRLLAVCLQLFGKKVGPFPLTFPHKQWSCTLYSATLLQIFSYTLIACLHKLIHAWVLIVCVLFENWIDACFQWLLTDG